MQIKKILDSRITVICHDVAMVLFAWFGAYEIHQNLYMIPPPVLKQAALLAPVIAVIQLFFFITLGLYRGVWRFASLPDLIQIVKAIALGVITQLLYIHFFAPLKNIPRVIPLLYALLLLIFLSLGRFMVRWRRDYGVLSTRQNKKRVLVVGSGNEAEMLIREMLRDQHSMYRPVAIVDQDVTKMHRTIHRIRMFGGFDKIKSVCEKLNIEIIFIALSNAKSKDMQNLLQECMNTGLSYRIMPSIKDSLRNKQILQSMREVKLEDLLGREAYAVDSQLFHNTIEGKTVLVTGGGGSIGSELCRRIAELNPGLLCIIDHSESNLFYIEQELRKNFPNLTIEIFLVSILQTDFIDTIFSRFKPEIVFHAAAYKHVPMLESQLMIAVQNNLIGSKNIVDASVKHNAKIFIQVSTDKAVNPTNIMGMTKRAAEMYCQQLNHRTQTKIMTVRFGNVLGSVGSVVPLFKSQIEQGGPVTVTHPDIERYFMTIPEACRLILQAMTMGSGGEIFVLDMGEPIKIKNLAEQMIRMAGKKAGEDINIVYTGLRAGEKLREELFYTNEALKKTTHQKIYQASALQLDTASIEKVVQDLLAAFARHDEKTMLENLKVLVPEYQAARTGFGFEISSTQ